MAPEHRDHIPAPDAGASAARSLQPHVEVVTSPAGSWTEASEPWFRARRLRLFAAVFLVVLLPGLAWDFLRPAQYRATAYVVTEAVPIEAPTALGPSPDTQHVAVQGRILLGAQLLESTLETLAGRIAPGIESVDELRRILEVSSQPDTHLVQLNAVGPNPARLADIVNGWIETYQEQRRLAVEEEVGETRRTLTAERDSLAATIAANRAALDRFRAENDIVTMERDGNEALARLRALNSDLNRARDEAVEAEARLDAIQAAIARGDPVVPPSEQGNLDDLEGRALELRGRLIELQKRYTQFYLENEPDVRVLPAQLDELEAKIAQKIANGQRVMLTRSEQEVFQARRRVDVLEEDLARQKETAGAFTARFAEYEALKDDLERLEGMHREAEARLVDVDARRLEDYPAVEVVEPAYPPTAPFHPRYWRDASWVLLAATLAGLCAVVLLEFLTGRPGADRAPLPVTGIRVFGAGDASIDADTAPAIQAGDRAPAIRHGPTASLPAADEPAPALPRELIAAEVGALWQLADPLSRQLMGLLLSGVSLEECAALDGADFDLEAGVLHVAADPPRKIPLSDPVRALFAGSVPLPLWAGSDLRHTPDDLAARIALLAHDAGLARPEDVTPDALRHSYMAFLVRSGARLTELPRRVGPVPPSRLSRYAVFAPSGPAKPLSEVDTLYPALKPDIQRGPSGTA